MNNGESRQACIMHGTAHISRYAGRLNGAQFERKKKKKMINRFRVEDDRAGDTETLI